LNKLSVTKFDKLSDEFMAVGLDTPELMQRAVEIIVSKAQMEEHFCFMYADLCRKITDKWTVKESAEGGSTATEDAITDQLGRAFRSRLLGRCEEEFNVDRVKELELIRNNNELTNEMKEEQEIITKKRYIGFYSLTHLLTHSLTHLLTYSLTQVTCGSSGKYT
jgi:translation initiation factor 4G